MKMTPGVSAWMKETPTTTGIVIYKDKERVEMRMEATDDIAVFHREDETDEEWDKEYYVGQIKYDIHYGTTAPLE